MKVVFKDISFKTDKDKINLEERIKKLSPETEISILQGGNYFEKIRYGIKRYDKQ